MTLLSIVQQVASLISVPKPTSVVNNTDLQVQQLYALANEEGRELAQSFNWTALDTELTFLTVADELQEGVFPPDFSRMINQTENNRSTRRAIAGPLSPQDWQTLKTFPAFAAPYINFRIREGELYMIPAPPDGQTCVFEYISSYWAFGANIQAPDRGPAPKVQFNLDTDTSVLDENIMALGVRWRYLAAKGLDYAEVLSTYERQKEQEQGRDGAAPILTLDGRGRFSLPVWPNLPIGSWNT